LEDAFHAEDKRLFGIEPVPLDAACAAFIRRNAAAKLEYGGDALQAMRAHAREMAARSFAQEDVGEIQDLDIPRSGAAAVRVRMYRPRTGSADAVLVWIHGGSWVRGDLTTHDAFFRFLVNRAGVVLIAMDQRLAPEARFPSPCEETMAVLQWLREEPERFGGAARRSLLGGDSSGANIAAATTLLARDLGPAIDGQVLLIPLLDARFRSPSWDRVGDSCLLTRDQLEWALAQYAPDIPRTEPMLSPLCAPYLGRLPPAIIVTAEYDPLQSDGLAYAAALHRAGVRVSHTDWPGMIHHAPLAASAMPIGATAVAAMAADISALALALRD
jgi:acetyl esterase